MISNRSLITDIGDSATAKFISENLADEGQALVIVSGRSRAERLVQDLSFFCDRKILMLPPDDEIFVRYDAKNQDEKIARTKVLKELRENPDALIVAPASGAIKRLPPKVDFANREINLTEGESFSQEDLKEKLIEFGYERTGIVYAPGTFSVRGGIIDVFVADQEDPFRIDFFGDEIESIKAFDMESQRSLRNISAIQIYPLSFDESHSKESEHLWDYLSKGRVFVEDVDRIRESLDLRFKEMSRDLEYMIEKDQATKEDWSKLTGVEDFEKIFSFPDIFFLQPFSKAINGIETYSEILSFKRLPISSYNNHMDILARDIRNYGKEGYRVIISSSSPRRTDALRTFLQDENLDLIATVKEGVLSTGMVLPEEKICYISDGNIFDSAKLYRKRKRRYANLGQKLESFTELKAGEYVVHDNHGIGLFQGIETINSQGTVRDYIKIKYHGNGTLYIPVEQMDIVQKYIGSDGKTPKLSKLGSEEWKRTKLRARRAINDMTDELIELYAKRKAESGYAFSEDTVWQGEFEDSFPFEETEDQLRSAEEIKRDMEKEEPMDRLLCGDVGYGKTEVAARAIFKCLIEGKQAAMLVPTTILANQHFATLKDRFKNYPFTIEMMSRFRTDKENKDVATQLEKGNVDFVIGTHRLLSNDVKFKDLGLLVVDEEQRFGVGHKEKIKKLKAGVDVLTLSATPIPRTLNMSLTGIRDMSLIAEPPEERYPVQTYVMEQDNDIIRDVIRRELDRDGQVFVVYNRVRGIVRIAERIQELVPEARIAVGHGQMSESSLEDVMKRFVDREIDVLIATTIVESGLDIPNANTLIVIDSDKCGLSQLYQLRGRVGRSNRIAYAYLMYQKEKVLTEVAEKRLRAIMEFTEFGAGFKIAMRDMELRGAGNVLGAEQSGHMLDIGYELYARMVDEAARKARGEIVPEKKEDFAVELKSNANIPAWYIDDDSIKLSMYKRIADIENEEDAKDVIEEMVDRFGEVPKEALNLVKISLIRTLTQGLGLTRLYEQNSQVYFLLGENAKISPYSIMTLKDKYQDEIIYTSGSNPHIRFKYEKNNKLDAVIDILKMIREIPKETLSVL